MSSKRKLHRVAPMEQAASSQERNEQVESPRNSRDVSPVHASTSSENEVADETVEKTAEEYFRKDETVYEDDSLRWYLKKVPFKRQKEFNITDHNFQLKAVKKRSEQEQPLLISILVAFQAAVLNMLKHLQQFYTTGTATQLYLTISQGKMTNTINTGNCSLDTPAAKITKNLFDMFFNYLKSNQTMRLDETLTIHCRILSASHTEKKLREGNNFKKHL